MVSAIIEDTLILIEQLESAASNEANETTRQKYEQMARDLRTRLNRLDAQIEQLLKREETGKYPDNDNG